MNAFGLKKNTTLQTTSLSQRAQYLLGLNIPKALYPISDVAVSWLYGKIPEQVVWDHEHIVKYILSFCTLTELLKCRILNRTVMNIADQCIYSVIHCQNHRWCDTLLKLSFHFGDLKKFHSENKTLLLSAHKPFTVQPPFATFLSVPNIKEEYPVSINKDVSFKSLNDIDIQLAEAFQRFWDNDIIHFVNSINIYLQDSPHTILYLLYSFNILIMCLRLLTDSLHITRNQFIQNFKQRTFQTYQWIRMAQLSGYSLLASENGPTFQYMLQRRVCLKRELLLSVEICLSNLPSEFYKSYGNECAHIKIAESVHTHLVENNIKHYKTIVSLIYEWVICVLKVQRIHIRNSQYC